MSIGSKIRGARELATFSVRELSRRTGIDESHLSKIENDKVSPQIDTIKRIAVALRKDWRELLE